MSSIERCYVFGAGGHGKVVYDALRAMKGSRSVGFLDDGLTRGTVVLDAVVEGTLEELPGLLRLPILIALGVGHNMTREQVAARCKRVDATLMNVVHPAAAISPFAQLSPGVVVMARAVVNASAVVDEGAIINTGAVVEHDVLVGAYAHVSPLAALGGGATLGARSHLGMGACILPGVSVGADCVVGAGAVVIHDLPDGVTAVGVPARVRT